MEYSRCALCSRPCSSRFPDVDIDVALLTSTWASRMRPQLHSHLVRQPRTQQPRRGVGAKRGVPDHEVQVAVAALDGVERPLVEPQLEVAGHAFVPSVAQQHPATWPDHFQHLLNPQQWVPGMVQRIPHVDDVEVVAGEAAVQHFRSTLHRRRRRPVAEHVVELHVEAREAVCGDHGHGLRVAVDGPGCQRPGTNVQDLAGAKSASRAGARLREEAADVVVVPADVARQQPLPRTLPRGSVDVRGVVSVWIKEGMPEAHFCVEASHPSDQEPIERPADDAPVGVGMELASEGQKGPPALPRPSEVSEALRSALAQAGLHEVDAVLHDLGDRERPFRGVEAVSGPLQQLHCSGDEDLRLSEPRGCWGRCWSVAAGLALVVVGPVARGGAWGCQGVLGSDTAVLQVAPVGPMRHRCTLGMLLAATQAL
mmetsp:Transcript_85480/g.250209  ORF Transcript_85480/g.250209 Transcript_85480/m.250209 type:complete len:426 (-) Transcript_85480:544-1821(-)